MKKTRATKLLSLALSLVMAFSAFQLLVVPAAAAGAGSVTDAMWTELATALKSDAVKNAAFGGTATAVTAVDPTGEVTRAAKAYFAVFNAYVYKNGTAGKANNDTEYKYGYRTSSQVRELIKNEMQNRMGADYRVYNAAGVIGTLGGPDVSSDSNSKQNSVPKTSFKVTVTNKASLLNFATLDEVSSLETYSYTVSHINGRYYTSKSGCDDVNNYYATVSSASASTGSADVDISLLRDYETALADNAAVLTATRDGKIEMGYDALSSAFNAITTAKNNAVGGFSATIVEHFFPGVNAQIDALQAAMKIAQFSEIVSRINGYVATDISEFDLAALTEIHTALKTDYEDYKAIGIQDVYDYFETEKHLLDRAAVEVKYEEIENAYQIAYLREVVKPQIEADVETYQAYDDDWVLRTDHAESAVAAARAALDGYRSILASDYKAENVTIVFGASYIADTFGALEESFAHLIEVNDWKMEFASYQSVYETAFKPVSPAYTTDQLYAVLNARDGWYTDLQNFTADLRAYDSVLADKILTDLEAAMEAKIDAVYALLNERVSDTVSGAYDLYQGFVAEYGYTINTSDEVTVANYSALRAAFGRLNPAHYEFLLGTDHFNVPQDVIDKYEEIRDAVFAFVNYDASKGLSAYKYNVQEIADIIRAVSDQDIARNLDYAVTDEKVEAIIDILEELLGSDALKDALGLDLSATVGGLLDKIYTNDFLNTLVQYVYPMVALEFAKVWAGLPESTVVDAGSPAGDVTINLSLIDMPTALGRLQLQLLPKLLASKVQAAFPEVAAQLNAVPNDYSLTDGEDKTWDTNPWENANIYDAETGKLTLDWGITDKESFLNAASAALAGVEPLLLALLSKKTYTASGVEMGTGRGTACGFVTVNVDHIWLKMTFNGNPGYNNAVAPILTALGADGLPDGNTLLTTRDVLDAGLFTPLENVLAGIADKPLDSILRLLPTLAFALEQNLVLPLLDQLKTNIGYTADAHYDAGFGGSDTKYDVMGDAININLGEMIDISSMGIDLTSLNGLLNSVIGLLTKPDDAQEGEEPAPALTLPEIDGATLAMLGSDVQWIPGLRTEYETVTVEDQSVTVPVSPFAGVEGHGTDYARIRVDNRADVFLFVLNYLFNGIANHDLLNNILDLINSSKSEDEKKVELSDMILEIVNNVVADSDNAVAAITELLFPQRYPMDDVKKIEWITEGNIGATDYDDYWTDVDAEGNETLWTKSKAVYMAEHLEDFLDDVVTLFGEQLGGAQTLGDAVDNLLAGLFTAETANKIPEALRGLLGGLELPEIVEQLDLFGQLGLDITAWDNMTFSFADGDKAAFKAALVTALEPLAPVLRFILAEEDIELTLLDAVKVKALGYDGYSYGLVPLLEALGANVMTTSAFKAGKANIVSNLVNSVFSVLDHLQASPLKFIEDVIPALIYFDKVQGVQAAIPNLLFAVNVLLDTIRPIYDVNLYQLIEEKLGFDIRFLETDPVDFVLTKVGELITENTEIELKVDFTVQSLSETLHFTDPVKFRSANGDDAYTIKLTDPDGKADLLTRVLDYGINQIVFEDNISNLSDLLKDVITDDATRAFLISILEILDNNDRHTADFHGVQDLTLSTIFWIFFGADSVTDASADFFVRYKGRDFKDIILAMLEAAPEYVRRAAFIMEEVAAVEAPNLAKALENAKELKKPWYEYTPEEKVYASNLLARILYFFMNFFKYVKALFSR